MPSTLPSAPLASPFQCVFLSPENGRFRTVGEKIEFFSVVSQSQGNLEFCKLVREIFQKGLMLIYFCVFLGTFLLIPPPRKIMVRARVMVRAIRVNPNNPNSPSPNPNSPSSLNPSPNQLFRTFLLQGKFFFCFGHARTYGISLLVSQKYRVFMVSGQRN